MDASTPVRDLWLRFCDAVTNTRVDQFDELVSRNPHMIIGTAPGEMVTSRDAMRFGMETEGVTLHSTEAEAFAEGTLGWVVDQPRFGFPDGSGFDCRVTAIARDEGDAWRLVHAHFSVGVPDDEIVDLQRRWAGKD